VSLSYLTTPSVYNVIATLGTQTPAVVSERSALAPGRIPTELRLRYACYRLAERILVNSEHQHERLAGAFPWMREKLVTIRNGVNLDHYRPPPVGRRRIPNRLDLLAVGSVHAGKNFLGLIEALRIHRERFGWVPSVRWVGRSGKKEGDVRAFEQAQHLIDRHNLREHWEWLGVRRDVSDLMQQSDALVHPSYFEGLPNVICEALASGLPVLAGAVCDHPWLVGDGERGLLFDPADPYDMAIVMQDFAELDQEGVNAMRRQARAFAAAELSVDVLLDRYEQLFREIA
jgi:glycosyltransferase involved in cell wall biosynthesis